VASAHAVVRKQFGMSIGNFEGIQEALARITGFTYIMDATRHYTMGGLDRGIKPPVITAMAKYYFTEMQRVVINHAMDIQGGQAISQGPRNLLANAYKAVPISITVEGANILTRTLIIFGQGALRAHPYASKEVQAIEQKDLQAFDRAFWGHVGHVIRNLFRSVIFSWTRGYCILPHKGGVTAKYYRRLAWASARFALMADIAMAALGGKLKAKGKVTGRFADVLSGMYMASAVLKRFEAEGRRKEDEPIVKWALQYCFARIQDAFDGLYGAIDIPLVGFIFKGPLRWLNGLNAISKMPSDELDFAVAKMIQTPGEFRDRLTSGIFIPKHTPQRHEQLGLLDETFRLSYESEAISRKVFKARKAGLIKKGPIQQMVKDAVTVGAITQSEAETLDRTEKMRWETIQVDDFGLEEYKTM
jgi:acyl-CoA dehydrogenase